VQEIRPAGEAALCASGLGWNGHPEGWNPRDNPASLGIDAQIAAFRHGGFRIEQEKRIVAEHIPWLDRRTLAHDPVPLDNRDFAAAVGHDPLAADNLDGAIGVIVDADEVNKAMWPIGRRGDVRLVNHSIHRHGQVCRFDKIRFQAHDANLPAPGAAAKRAFYRPRGVPLENAECAKMGVNRKKRFGINVGKVARCEKRIRIGVGKVERDEKRSGIDVGQVAGCEKRIRIGVGKVEWDEKRSGIDVGQVAGCEKRIGIGAGKVAGGEK